MLDRAPAMTWTVAPGLPVPSLVIGKPAEEAAEILPRIYNLCRGAQSAAARLALGLPLEENASERLHSEILRDHVLMLAIKLPRHFCIAAQGLAVGWVENPSLLRSAFFGTRLRLPKDLASLETALSEKQGVFDLLSRIRSCFDAGEAACDAFPVPDGADCLELGAMENSVAGRWVAHPLMQAVEAQSGRGPFWRVLGRVVEIDALIAGTRLGIRATPGGEAFVPAARGTYAVAAAIESGKVAAFRRVTPTDHLMAEDGILDQSLARLPARKRGLAPLLLDILDPCVPVRLEETTHA